MQRQCCSSHAWDAKLKSANYVQMAHSPNFRGVRKLNHTHYRSRVAWSAGRGGVPSCLWRILQFPHPIDGREWSRSSLRWCTEECRLCWVNRRHWWDMLVCVDKWTTIIIICRCQGYKRVIKVIQSLPVLYDFYYTVGKGRRDIKHINYSMRNPRVLCNIQATRPRACACILHKSRSLMLYLLYIVVWAIKILRK